MRSASIIVINCFGAVYLDACLNALLAQIGAGDEIIVVDNDSIDSSVEFLRSHFPNVKRLCNGHDLGYAGGANVGLRAASGDVSIVLTPDVTVHEGWLIALKDVLMEKVVGVAGCKFYYLVKRSFSTLAVLLRFRQPRPSRVFRRGVLFCILRRGGFLLSRSHCGLQSKIYNRSCRHSF